MPVCTHLLSLSLNFSALYEALSAFTYDRSYILKVYRLLNKEKHLKSSALHKSNGQGPGGILMLYSCCVVVEVAMSEGVHTGGRGKKEAQAAS